MWLEREDIGVRSTAFQTTDLLLRHRCSDGLRYESQGVHSIFYIVVIAENRKHPSSPKCLVCAQKVMEGSELELAKVPMEYQTRGLG